MRYLISKGDYARVTAGMTPEQVAEVDAQFAVYPDIDPDGELLVRVDQDRIGAAYARLLADEPLPLVPSRPVWFGGRRNGRSRWHLPAPWDEIGPEVWWAPAGTPPPGDWIPVEDLVGEYLTEEATSRRYFLNDWTPSASAWNPEKDGNPLDDMREFMRRWRDYEAPPPRLLKAGDNALTAIAAGARPVARGWPKDPTGAAGALADLAGIPIVRDPDLPPNAWQLVDPRSGEVLYEGDISDRLGEYVRVMREYSAEVAEQAGLPRDFFDPDGL
jgi:hypothetical protein